MNCSGLLGRTPLRRQSWPSALVGQDALFRSSRPDSIETGGYSGRHPLLRVPLFRSSRPDSIETRCDAPTPRTFPVCNCSGLLGRTPLRLRGPGEYDPQQTVLFRSSRPDSIETQTSRLGFQKASGIVPVF